MDKFRAYMGAVRKYYELGIGSSCRVYLCDFFDTEFAYKDILDKNYAKFIKEKLMRVAEYYEDSEFVFPYKFIYKAPQDEVFEGYVMDALHNYTGLEKLKGLDIKEKIEILKKGRVLLDSFHKKYNLVHTDVASYNFQYNEKTKDIKLIDFDTNIDLKEKDIIDLNKYNLYASHYMHERGVDENLDIFLYNLTVFSLLNNVSYFDTLEDIANGVYGVFEENNNAKKIFESYNDLNCNKSLKKEYVIDYM